MPWVVQVLKDSGFHDCSWTLNNKLGMLTAYQENSLLSYFQTVNDLEASAVKEWGQAWSILSGVPLEAGKQDLSRPAGSWFTGMCQMYGANLTVCTLFWDILAITAGHIAHRERWFTLLTPEIFIFFEKYLLFGWPSQTAEFIQILQIPWSTGKSFLLMILIYHLVQGGRKAQC